MIGTFFDIAQAHVYLVDRDGIVDQEVAVPTALS